jgi:hypothetical protein
MSDAERATVSQNLLRRYEGGASIREICRETGYSIGRVRRLLEDAGVTYRRRGGANRSRGGRPTGAVTEQPAAQPPAAPGSATTNSATTNSGTTNTAATNTAAANTESGHDDPTTSWRDAAPTVEPGERPIDNGTAR